MSDGAKPDARMLGSSLADVFNAMKFARVSASSVGELAVLAANKIPNPSIFDVDASQ